MPIRFQYDAAAVAPPSSNELKKYGGQMLMQQRKYDLDQRNDQARISQLGAMRNFNAQPQRVEPSRAEQMQFRDQAIRSGAFSPAMIKNIRDIEKEQGAVMRDKSLNAEQMADAMAQLDAQMRVAMSMGYPQQMVEARSQVPSGPRQPMTSAQAFAADPKLEEKFMGFVDPNNPDGSPKPYEQRLREALAIRDAREKILFGQPQGQQQQGAPPAGQPQASITSPQVFGSSTVLAQGGFGSPQPQGQMPPQSSDPRFSHTQIQPGFRFPGQGPENPKGVKMVLASMPPQYVLNDGTQVDSKWENGQWVPDIDQTGPRSMMLNGGQRQPNAQGEIQQNSMRLVGEPGIPNLIAGLGGPSDYQPQSNAQGGMGVPVGQSAYQPTGDYSSKPVFGVQPVLAQQAASQQAAPATPVATPQTAPTTTPEKRGARGYVSISPQGQSVTALGRNAMYNERGEFVGDPGLYDRQGADYIRQQAAGAQGAVAQPVLTGKAGFDAAMGSNMDTAYDLANMDRSPGTNILNPENPVYAAMRAPAPQQNTGNVGQFKGRYGLGGVDYGINPATGNRVTASIRPGGGLEFDEPVGKPGTAMGGRKGSVTIMGGKKKPAAEVSPGASTPEQQAAYNALPEAPVVSPSAPAAGADYQYQSPIAQSVATAPQSATPARKYGGSSLTSPAGREVEAAMQAGEELAAREQAIGQQQAFQGATAPPPVPMSDEKQKELGLPTTKELKEMRRSMDQNRAMGGIGLGGTGRAAGSYSPPTSAQKPKESPKAGKPTSQQTVMSKAIKDFASKQPSDVQDAIRDAYDTKLSDRLRENAVRFLLSRGIDLEKMAPNS
jgi:hypothetical protein